MSAAGMKNGRNSSLILLFAVLFAGCASGPKFIVSDYRPPSRIAVLLFANETNDVEGPDMVRRILIEQLPSRGYSVIPKEDVDSVLLNQFGITEGGQLPSVTPKEIGGKLDADALFYGNLLNFVDFPFGFGRKRTVKANFKLVDAASGDLIWEDERSWTTPEIYINPEDAKRAAVRQVAERQIEKMTGHFLERESRIVVERALKNLPACR